MHQHIPGLILLSENDVSSAVGTECCLVRLKYSIVCKGSHVVKVGSSLLLDTGKSINDGKKMNIVKNNTHFLTIFEITAKTTFC